MMQNDEELTAFADTAAISAESGTLKNVVFSGFADKETEKMRGELRLIGGECVVQFETRLSEGRVRHDNVGMPGLRDYILGVLKSGIKRADLNDSLGTASLMISKKGKITFISDGNLKKRKADGGLGTVVLGGNDRQKNRMLDGSERFLVELGISDKNGRIHDKRQSKFRQICRFAENVRDILPYIKKDGTVHIADLCCGKSYLSFAVYHCFTEIFGRDVDMVCVDMKKSVMEECAGIAERLGYDGMHFICADITGYVPNEKPDLVVSLHACDTATDVVLDFAAKWRADVILSTPCCHRYLSRHFNCAELDFVAKNPILKQKLCDAATDALRLLRLEAAGYKTEAIELIDPEDTPKNVLLRAYRQKNFILSSPEAAMLFEKYASAYRYFTGADPKPLDTNPCDGKN